MLGCPRATKASTDRSAPCAERCHEIYREKASAKAVKGRSQLEKAIDAVGTGDVNGSSLLRTKYHERFTQRECPGGRDRNSKRTPARASQAERRR
jgi:hypothetical protein